MVNVSKYRKFIGMTQSDVAKILGISLQAYYKKEKQKTPFSDNEKVTLKNLFSEEFPGITIDEIFFDF